MKHWLVTVMIEDRYWSVQVWVDSAESAKAAMEQSQAQFDEATRLGYVMGAFKAIEAVEVRDG